MHSVVLKIIFRCSNMFRMQFMGYGDVACVVLRVQKNFYTDGGGMFSVCVEENSGSEERSNFDDFDSFLVFLREKVPLILERFPIDYAEYTMCNTILYDMMHETQGVVAASPPSPVQTIYRWKERTLDRTEVVETIAEHVDMLVTRSRYS